jgi:hypothetical protein
MVTAKKPSRRRPGAPVEEASPLRVLLDGKKEHGVGRDASGDANLKDRSGIAFCGARSNNFYSPLTQQKQGPTCCDFCTMKKLLWIGPFCSASAFLK